MNRVSFVTKRRKLDMEMWLTALLALLLCSCTALLSLRHKQSLDEVLGYGVLPATQSLLHGEGFTICSSELAKTSGDPICYHSARMPMAEWVMASGIKLLGKNIELLTFYKATLLLLPLVLAVSLVYRRMLHLPQYHWLVLLLLLTPFTILPFTQDVIRLDFEEAYSYSFIALAFAISLFLDGNRNISVTSPYLAGTLAAACAAGIYLSKSSMSLFASVFLFVFLLKPLDVRVRVVVLLLSALAPLGWAAYQHHASGRYSFGTSLDGVNLHMGNSEHFLRDYPPHPGFTLDDTALELNTGVHFKDEWDLNDYHKRAALSFITHHRQQALNGEWRKFCAVFLSVQVVGTYASLGSLAAVARGGVVLFRIIFSVAIVSSAFCLWRGDKSRRKASLIFLLFTAAIASPYMAGFAYTRHISVLIFPSCFFCCRLLINDSPREDLSS